MASKSDSIESFSKDHFHSVGAAFAEIESGVRRVVMDLQSRLMDSGKTLERLDFRKKPSGGLVAPTTAASARKRSSKMECGCFYVEKRNGADEGEGSCANCMDLALAWSFLTDTLQFKSIKRCFMKPESLPSKLRPRESKCEDGLMSQELMKASLPKKGEVFLLENDLCLALQGLVQAIRNLNDGIKRKGRKKYGPLAAPEPLPSQYDLLEVIKGIIKGRKADFDVFLSDLRFARVGLLSGLAGVHSSKREVGEACGSSGDCKEGPKNDLVQQSIRNALISIPLSSVEKLKSTLATVSMGELIELVPNLGWTSKDHPDKKKLFSVQDFFRYSELEGRRLFEELDRDRDGQITLEDLEIAMKKRKLPKMYAREFFRRTRRHFFSKSIGWKQFLSLMERREPTILRLYMSLCLSKFGTLQLNQILKSLKSAGLPANEDNAIAMMRYLNADKGGSISYSHFRNFMLLLPSERLQDDPRNIWFEAATVVPVSPPVEIATESLLKSALAGGLACAISTATMHPLDTLKTRVQASTLSFHELTMRLPQIGLQGLYRGSIPAIVGQFSSHGLRTGIFEAIKVLLTNVAPTIPEIQVQSMASFCSTLLGTAVRIPCEVLKQRLQAGIFDNVGEAIVGTLHQDGIKGFFRGTGATLCREVPFYVAGMCLYAETKKAAQNLLRRELEPWETILVGALSGGIAAVVTTPFDVMKTRMMTSPQGLPVSMQAVTFTILRQEGPLGLFKGVVPRFFWIAPLGALNFAGYELARNAMDRTEDCKTGCS
ncbi:hypothetical protein HPP92_006481 [Vanilla planifolia]|uniref:EF-hand domain-containing protein n=1 Tax=Vanilla planifolia TaxID=51239 RepID=A0A835RNY2_VANPL|nr:hypothetical protein HPP92_006481 [Vanilla planifolia]